MKKAILAVIVVILVFAFTLPIYADQPPDPGGRGQMVSGAAQLGDNILSDWVNRVKKENPEYINNKNLGLAIKLSLYEVYGVPPKHTP